jgi:hypothetical protein
MRRWTTPRLFRHLTPVLAVVWTFWAGVASSQSLTPPVTREVQRVEAVQDAAPNFTIFPFPSSWREAGDEPWADAAGSNTWVGWKDALWFPVYNVWGSASPSSLARLSLDGTFSLIPFNQGQGYVSRIGIGPDTALWWSGWSGAGTSHSVGRFSPSGLVDLALPIAREPTIPASGADGALWYGAPGSGLPEALGQYIGRTTPEGVNSLFPIPNLTGSPIAGIFECYPGEVAAGSDGQMWFSEFCWNFGTAYPGPWSSGAAISSISSTGVFTRYQVNEPTGDHSQDRALSHPVAGPDGAMWWGLNIGSYDWQDERSGLARITMTGGYTEYLLPRSPCPRRGGVYSGTRDVRNPVVGLDGALWFTESVFLDERCISYESRLGRYDLATGNLTEYVIPVASGTRSLSLTQGPDGALWLMMLADLLSGREYSVVRFSPPGLKVVVTADRTTVPATGLVTARAVVTNTTAVTTAPARLTLTEGEGAMYAHKGDTDNGTFGTVAGVQNVVHFDMGAFAPGEQKTFEVPLMIVPLIDAADVKVTADFSVGADGTFGETKTLEITATPITAVQDSSTFADLIALPVADLGTNPDGLARSVAAVETFYPSDLGDMWSLYVTESLSRWSRKDKSLYFTLKRAGFSARSAYAAVYMRALMDLKPSGSCIPSGSEMAKASAKMWWAVQQARWFKGKETSFFSAFENVAAGLGGCNALYPMNLVEFHDKYTAPLVKVMSDSFARFALTYANVELQVCNYVTDGTRMTVPLPRLVEADIDYRLARGSYHPILHNKVLAQVDIRNGSGGTMLLGSAIYQILEQGASQCDMVQAMQSRNKWVSIQVHSPLMPLVTDALGRKSGVDAQTRKVYDEIPGAMMAPGHPWQIHLLASGAPFEVTWTTAYGGAFGIDVQGQTDGVTTSTRSFASGAVPGFSASQTIDVTLDAGRVIASATTGALNRPIAVTALTATAGAWVYGQSVEFVATVTGAGGSPSGSVTFQDGPTTLATVSLIGGEARYSTASLSPGAHSVTATYGGDGTFAGSTSPALSRVVIDNRPAPTVSVGHATLITKSSAKLNATVNPNGVATTAYFQYGRTASYGSTTPNETLGSGVTALALELGAVTGLACGTTYHFRAVATSAVGPTNGADATFTTTACGPAISLFTASPVLVNSGGSSLLSWSVEPGATLTLNGSPIAGPTGSQTVNPVATTAYALAGTDSSGTSTRSVTVVVNDGSAGLGTPTITAPTASQTVIVTGVGFTWTAVASATAYDIRVFNGTTGALLFSGSLQGAGSTSTLVTLDSGSYRFAVRACAGGLASTQCGSYASVAFSVSPAAPSGAPTVTFPAAGANLTQSTQTLAWTSVTPNPLLSGLTYELLLSNLTNGTTALQITVPSPATSTIFTMPGAQYELKVRACQAACGPWSTSVNFSVTLPSIPASAPVISSCTISGGNSLTCNWGPVANADTYQVLVVQPPPAGPGGGALTAAAVQVSATTVTLPVPPGPATVLISACNGDGCGPYATTPIDVPGLNPSAPNLGTPMAGTVVSGPTVLFTWNRIPGDNGSNTTYRLFVQDLSRQQTALDIYTTSNFYGAYFKAEGARYDALVIANPGPSQIVGPAQGFNVAGLSATAPTMVSPAHNSTVPSGNIQLGWSPVPGATLYEYFVAVLGQPDATARGVTPGLLTQVPLTGSGLGTVYSGIVRACPLGATCVAGVDAGWGPWSNAGGPGVTNFTVIP